ncbi:MAG TPA: flagellar hook-length control protein FliK, partial [Candidatus Omnitrophota bacterium]|nr:flagellar hook-length control protein FliK [Candidatus Omnitrophota bacterium]
GGDDVLVADDPAAGTASTQTQAASSATQAQGKQQAQGNQAAGTTELAQQQAEDMAAQLADTGAAVKVNVKVDDKAAAAAADTTAQTDAAAAADLVVAQVAGAETEADGQAQTGQSQTGQNQNGQNANAAQQVLRNGALENAQAAQGKASSAKPFAAALAQETGSTGQATQANSGNQTQNVAGVNAANATQATQKTAQAQAAQAPQQPRHVDPKQVVDQISVQISKQAKDGGDTIKVQLKPTDLGSIEIKLEVQDGRVTAHVTADNKDTLAALQKDARGLEKALQDAGLKTEQGALTFSLSNDNKQAQQEAGQQGKPGRRSRLARAHEASQIGAASAAQPLRAGGRSGVDIRV